MFGKSAAQSLMARLNVICQSVVLVVVISVTVQGQSDVANSVSKNNQETFETLETTTTSLDCFETRFSDVLKSLTEATSVSFRLHESARDNNLTDEELVSATFQNTRLATVLEFLLNDYDCTWSIKDGVVVIISNDAASDYDQMGRVVCDSSGVLANIKPIKERGFHPPSPWAGGGRSAGGGIFSVPEKWSLHQGGSGFGAMMHRNNARSPRGNIRIIQESKKEDDSKETKTGPATKPSQPILYEITISPKTQLLNTIQETIDPDSWEVNGGNAKISSLGNTLIIVNTQANLRAINQLLGDLRSTSQSK